MQTGNRIAKEIARRGYCSRREAERLIASGMVKKDGELVSHPATIVTKESHIEINNNIIIAPEKTRVWLYHKPKGLITTHRDPQGRKTVFENLPKEMPRVISVGRLDYNTEGLLILTNDGELARTLELPTSGIERVYKCRVFGTIPENFIKIVAKGCLIDGIQYGSIKAKIIPTQDKQNLWIELTLTEGKNREIRRICEFFGLQVNRLIRLKYGPFELKDLSSGQVKEIQYKEGLIL